ncbi:MAG: PAS domain S-box protein [Methanobacteriaceae archaeon]|nr:PAS domain S-box protein [Methanobacteriaceae archaeon]
MEEDNNIENQKTETIMVVDDEPTQLFAISRILQSAGYNVLQASSGGEALKIASSEHPDLILLDVVLPDMDGVEVSKEIKKDKSLKDILIILISGIKTSSDSQSKGLEEGADGYLTRPIPKRELLARVESLLRIKRAKEELLQSEEKYRLIVENAQEGIWSIDSDAKTMFVNPCMADMLGYTVDEMLGKSLFEFMDDNAVEMAKMYLERRKNGIEEQHDFEFLCKDGEKIYTSMETSPINDDEGNFVGAIALVSNITQRKKMEEELKKSLNEKEMLLKEIHHRVKNNLMIISSLLNLQSRYIKDKESQDIFKESQNRARSMALIHERLYQSTDLKRIDFGDYIRTLSQELFRTYATGKGNIELKLQVEDVFLDINTAIPLGLIVNELLTNSLKHAFPQEREGEIMVSLISEDGFYFLIVKDNGVGIPEDFDYLNAGSLGLQMVNSLTQQIDGEIELIRSGGTEFKIKFGEETYK